MIPLVLGTSTKRCGKPQGLTRPAWHTISEACNRTILWLCSRQGAAWPVALRHNLAMLRYEPAWWFEYSINCGVTVEFAWSFWTHVNNWALDADVESVEIDGPFVAGARGVTNSKSSGRIEWQIVEAQAGRAVIEFPLSGALGRFFWAFEETVGGVRITQRCALEGPQATAYAKRFGPSLEAGIPAGMKKLCITMEGAARTR